MSLFGWSLSVWLRLLWFLRWRMQTVTRRLRSAAQKPKHNFRPQLARRGWVRPEASSFHNGIQRACLCCGWGTLMVAFCKSLQ